MLSGEKCDGRGSCFRIPDYIIKITYDFLNEIEMFCKKMVTNRWGCGLISGSSFQINKIFILPILLFKKIPCP